MNDHGHEEGHAKIEGDATGGVIPYKNMPTLMAYYCGIFSLIPIIGVLLGIASIILGIVGIRKYNENPELHGVVHAWVGIVMGALVIVGHFSLVVLIVANW